MTMMYVDSSNNNKNFIYADVCEMIPGLCLNGKCISVPGGYRCMCNVGYKLTMDGKRCLGETLSH